MRQSLVIQRITEEEEGKRLREARAAGGGGERNGKTVRNHATLSAIMAPGNVGRIGDTLIKYVLSHRPISPVRLP
jgi:hypothetical protein